MPQLLLLLLLRRTIIDSLVKQLPFDVSDIDTGNHKRVSSQYA